MSIYSIYKSTNKINGKTYIGFDSNWPQRKQQHNRYCFNKNSGSYSCFFHNALRKYGIDNFEWEVIYQSKDGQHCLKKMETHFIEQYNTFNDGYNMTLGGEGVLGYKLSEESKNKISISKKGTKASLETKKLFSEQRMGKNNPMFGKPNSGYKHTKEHKKYIANKLSKEWLITDLHDKQYTIKNLQKFCRENKLSQSSMVLVSQGKQNNHKGWKCIKLD